MKVLVVNCSPKKELSITYKSSLFLEKYYGKTDDFKYIFAVDGRFPEENFSDFDEADLVIICSSMYHYSIHAQMIRLFADMERNLRLNGKCMTYLTTSVHKFDQNPHRTVRLFAERNNCHYFEGLSLADVSVLPSRKEGISPKEKFHGLEELYTWFGYTKACLDFVKNDVGSSFEGKPVIAIVDGSDTNKNKSLVDRICSVYEQYGGKVKVINLRDYDLHPCVGCNTCYTNCVCCIKDDFEKVLNEIYMDTDIVVNVSDIRYGVYDYLLKIMFDRQVQYGRRGINDEVIELFVCTGPYTADEMNCFIEHEMGMQSMTGSFIVGYSGTDEPDLICHIYKTVAAYNNSVLPPTNYYTVSLGLLFARLSIELKNLSPKDYEYYKTKTDFLDEVQPLPMLRPLNSAAEAREHNARRLIPYDKVRESLPDTVMITDRRSDKSVPMSERKRRT